MNLKPNQSGLKPNRATNPADKAGPGRPKGSPNKNNLVRNWIELYYEGGVGGYIETILDTIDQVKEPKEKGRLLIQLLAYIAPQLKSVDTTIALDNDNKLTIVYSTVEPKKIKPDVDV